MISPHLELDPAPAVKLFRRCGLVLSHVRGGLRFRMNAGAITITIAALIATFDLSFRVGSDPVLPVMLAGAFLLAVLLAGP